MVTASDIVGEATGTNNFLEEMRRLHKARLRTGIRNLEDKMINLMSDLDTRPGGRLEGIKINLKQSQKIHAKMVNIFEEEYGQTVSRMVGEYGQIASHIKRSWRSLGESVQFTDVDKAMLTSLQGQAYDQFSVFGEAAQRRMADAMYSSVVAGASYAQLLNTVKGILRGKKDVRGRSMLAYADTHSFDAIMNFHNDVNIKKSEDLGIKKFMYVGDIITTTRPFCRRRAGKLYTRAQIDRWNTLSWSGKSGPPFTHRGGYNCRHHWRGMKDEWVEMADDVGAGLQGKPLPKKGKVKKAPKGKTPDSQVLNSGRVSSSGKPKKGGINQTDIKTLEFEGKELRGAFKPISGEAFTGGGTTWEPYLHLKKCPQAYREAMAYQVDEALNFGLVPETIIRKLDGELGSLQRWVERSTTAINVTKPIAKVTAKEIYKTSVFDYITGSVDRHMGNWLVNVKTGKITLIDNGLAFCTNKTTPRSLIPHWYSKVMNPGVKVGELSRMIDASYSVAERGKLVDMLKALDVDSICGKLTLSERKAMKNRIAHIIGRIRGGSVGKLTFSKKLQP